MSYTKARRTKRLRRAVKTRYGRTCWLCGKPIQGGLPTGHPQEFSIDHFVPRSEGGTDDLENLRPTHRRCNNERERNTVPISGQGRGK